MDDLSGLDWSAPAKSGNGLQQKPPVMNSPFASLQPTPSPQMSSRSTPVSAQPSGFSAPKPTPQPSKPAGDSFSNLVNFGAGKSNANMSLRERQAQLEADKLKKEAEQRKAMQAQYGGGQFWDSIGQGSSQQASRTASPAVVPTPPQTTNDDDLFAAFNKDTKVDNASHYPPPQQLDLTSADAWNRSKSTSGGQADNTLDDDDPFGLNEMKPQASRQQPPPAQNTLDNDDDDDDDDILGDLGKPVDQVRRQPPAPSQGEPGKPIDDWSDSSSEDEAPPPRPGRGDGFDQAVAEIVDMGFTADNARRALTESGAGLNVQAAIGWLLDEAHRKSRNQPTPGDSPADRNRRDDSSRSRRDDVLAQEMPSRGHNDSPVLGDDISKRAAAMGTSFMKTANSLWKTGSKQVQKAYADFQQEAGDPSQPKWMQSRQQERSLPEGRQAQNATDEAMMLESGARPERQPSRPTQSRTGSFQNPASLPSRSATQSPSVPRWQQGAPPPSSLDPRTRLSKQAADDDSAQAYVSPARRKKTTPKPPPAAEPEPDLLFNTSATPPASTKTQAPTSRPPTSRPPPSKPITPRPGAPARNIPSVSPSVLQASTKQRVDGTAHFKRGDYDAAHTAYTNSLSGIPQTHPLCIVLLTNRALTALKTGSPKQAVEDANNAISIIGPSRGDGEKVALPDGEQRDMKDLFGKALSRKAEALEQMEKWSDASDVWQQCVEAGVGGATAAAGRQRCQKALAPKPKPAARPPARPKPKPAASAMADLGSQDSDAVKRLREQNKAAEAADDEKFALGEKVDARISLWRDGKRDNLRALIGSLDQVLWEGSGWKKVGLHELVMANKVKIHYMKAIAKCHPDKLPQDSPAEVQLIAATVFATLNESWDKFKADNGL